MRLPQFLYVALYGAVALAQVPEPQPPGFNDPERPLLTSAPQEADFGFLRNPAKRTDFWDRLKFLPINGIGTTYLTLGLEYRTEYEYVQNANFGSGPQTSTGYSLQRLMPRVDLRFTPNVRVFTELEFDYENGRNGGPRPRIDQDPGNVHQAFAEFKLKPAGIRMQIRAGRQELVFGSGRLIDNSEGVNVKSSFDGLRASFASGQWKTDFFAVRPVAIHNSFFDNWPDHRQSFWGMYTTAPSVIDPHGKIDLYYLGLDNKLALFQKGVGREIRHSGGVRLFRPTGAGWDYNWEPVVQWGSFSGRSIHAWTVASETGYTFENVRYQPRLAVRSDAASGDDASKPNRLGTFNPLFPRGAYYGPKLNIFGPYNVVDVHGALLLKIRRNITSDVDWAWFWRESTSDGLYSNSGSLLRPGNLTNARYIGARGGMGIRWALDRHLIVAGQMSGMMPGTFLTHTAPGERIFFFNIGITYRL